MINCAVIMGRITNDLQLRQTPSGISTLSFTVAVDRSYQKQGEERQTDFINCVAWRQQAEFISRYFGKGRMIAIEGQLQSRTYQDKNGSNHQVIELNVQQASFTGEAKQNSAPQGNNYQPQNNGYQPQNNSYQQPNNSYQPQNNSYQPQNNGYQQPNNGYYR